VLFRSLGILKTQSVGFIPLEYVEQGGPGWTEVTKKLARRWAVDIAEHFKNVKRIHTKWLLLEHSDVSVSSDPYALQQAVSKGAVSPEMLRDLGVDTLPGEPMPIPDGKPYPNEHACRLRDPGAFQEGRFRRVQRQSDSKTYSVIMGRLKGSDTMTEQAYRYPKGIWSASEARAHCKRHGGRFEAASQEGQAFYTPCASCGGGKNEEEDPDNE